MSTELEVALLLVKQPEFHQACENLESTDRAVFDAAQLTIQRLMTKIINDLITECDKCTENYTCPQHTEALYQTSIMLTDECTDPDKPVFRGA